MHNRLQHRISADHFLWTLLGLFLLLPAPLSAQKFPWPEGEKLEMELFWPSGVSLGEATLEARSVKDKIFLSAYVEVGLPQGRILYRFASTATAELCSSEFKQSVQRSGTFWEEITRFDAESGQASVSRGGQPREMPAAKCSRDPLTYLYWYRAQAAAEKRPSPDSLFLAGPLNLQIEARAGGPVKINRIERRGELYIIRYPGAMGTGQVELWLDGTPRQTPIAVRLPLPLATFSAELR